ncbi:E3 ubiquitin-protein ligase AMFR-like [Homalodisca vitripennis]|uniref:E3 ubiquitin-protein ligase AMFR-like n=1 Tax=Homalodisca vitripennis TaxID=197043 RepID=UPI001EEA8D5A|nr:E3 ubiquitin-protein ligase AMFR-like [Homalodisca vitripennis]
MARTVQQLFPHLPLSVIIDDLHITRSVELTVENVLEGHVQAPTAKPPAFSTHSDYHLATPTHLAAYHIQ